MISPLYKHKNHRYMKQNLKINKIKNKMIINKTIKERRKKTKRKTRIRTKIKEAHEDKLILYIFIIFYHVFN